MRAGYIFKLLILILALFLLLNLPEKFVVNFKLYLREGLYPLQKTLVYFYTQGKGCINIIYDVGNAICRNQELLAELTWLRSQLRDLKALEAENSLLRERLFFAQKANKELIASEIIGRDISGWWQYIILGSGFSHGVQPNCAVITCDGLIGKTTKVSAQTTEVILICDPACKVSAYLPRTGAFGVLQGRGVSWNGRASCRLYFINKDLQIKEGDEVVTSGLGGIFPKGLLIGYIDKIFEDRSGLYQYADIVLKADLGQLSYVFIINSEEDSLAELLRQKNG